MADGVTSLDRSRAHARARNEPQPITSLRDWLDHLAARDRLAVINPGAGLRFELAAIAKRLDGERATLFPRQADTGSRSSRASSRAAPGSPTRWESDPRRC